ncbi:MAG: Gfo/Idh/MocA family oxidoreductase [Nitrospinaceae bacterium]|nr:Gfo/Idh/MocA family oxidoreductase [Nitrospinaceae bacterium]NIR55749.1 Gfo/Idh/MocA family oxidoreductase [Nitrospinaceae bacterium]NIS86190.1 Gfo/Idh/MocA family oxidoreductase [Nitrospinaceae bacterium]NIT83028.1 Gfo/Idh/MocA family oxidoreductase [Nitrospinaceae bacterium]NIU45241.1 Gfo/Idh/MocA family oxidoreductase [Nitrospinaceae bacterium]
MKQVLTKQGQIVVEDIPAPQVEPGTILVRAKYSCISAGTEMSGLKSASDPLWKRAIKNPGAVKTALEMVAARGVTHTRNVIEGKLAAGRPLGYSAAGTVLEVGEGVEDIHPGDLVACAGAQYAHHAEIIRVPRNLTVPVPQDIDLHLASTVTLGAIALQGIRRANPTLGETFVVIGLGILGQITVQLLKANGCRVIGSDLDPARVELAQKLGMDGVLNPEGGNGNQDILRMTDDVGADGAIITAASSSHEVISNAFKVCRRKGRVVLVGDVGLNLKREDFYAKELDFFVSTSYGPGRYDPQYEDEGVDYPIGYVRWTENRNMSEYLKLISEKKLNVQPLINSTVEISQANEAYEKLNRNEDKPLIILLSYPEPASDEPPVRTVANPTARSTEKGKIRIALAGTGGFMTGMHIPNLQALGKQFHIHSVFSRTGNNAANTAKQVEAVYSTTDYEQILNDSGLDAILIATRHHVHADMTLKALQAGKHVLVEKPLALTREELNRIQNFFSQQEQSTVLLTGFNRRFSPFARRIKKLLKNRKNPIITNYRMNAGYIPLDHWVHTREGGGRNLGEACHIYDLFTYLIDSKVSTIHTQALNPSIPHYSARDNFVVTLGFEDGSVATLTYTALGSTKFPKEQMEVFSDGRVFHLNDYKQLDTTGVIGGSLKTQWVDKGHKQELQEFGTTILKGGPWPIPLWQQIQATEIALRVEEQLS